jgi:hypothetical protein
MDLLHRIDPVSGIYLNSSYQVGSPYIQSNWTLIEKELPNPNIFNVTKWNFETLEWQEGLTQAELDVIAALQALENETNLYKIRQCDGVAAYAKISAEFRLAKLNGVITEEAHAVIEQALIVVRNEVLSGQWKSARLELENIGSAVIGAELYDRLHLQLSDYIALSY